MVKTPPSNARNMGSIPGQGIKIPYAAEQLSLHVTTTEHENHNHRVWVQGKILHDATKIPHTATKPLSSKKKKKKSAQRHISCQKQTNSQQIRLLKIVLYFMQVSECNIPRMGMFDGHITFLVFLLQNLTL